MYIKWSSSREMLPQKRNFSIDRTDRGEGRIYDRSGRGGRKEGRKERWERGRMAGCVRWKIPICSAVPQDQSLRRWRCSVSWTILHSGTGIMRGLIGRSSTSNRNTRDGCNLQGKWSRNSSPSERRVLHCVACCIVALISAEPRESLRET